MGKARRRKQERPSEPAPAAGTARRDGGAFPSAALFAPLLIAGLGWLAFANSFSIPFLFDDHFAIVGNPDVKRLAPLSDYFTTSRGLPALLSALNYRWAGFEVWGYHLVNVSVHVLNALLVWLIAGRMLRLPALAPRYGERASPLALATALVFLLHPLQTSVASYIVQRSESVAALFVLFAVYAYLRGAVASVGARRAQWYAAMLGAAFLAMVSKESAVVLPLLLLLIHLVLRPSAASGAERGTRWILAAALLLPVGFVLYLSWAALFPAPPQGGDQRAWMYIPTAGLHLEGITPWTYLLTQFGVIVWYLRLFVAPTRLCFDYGWPFQDSLWSASVLAPLAALLALVAAALWSARRYPLAALGIGWFFIALAPSSSILPIRDAAFEYRMYLPLFGLALLAVTGGSDLCRWLEERGTLPRRSADRAAAVLGVLWIAVLTGATVQRNYVLQDEYRLFADAAAKAPGNWRNHAALGNLLLERKRADEAMQAFETALRLKPDAGTPRIPLADLYAKRGRLDEAEKLLLPATKVPEESVAAAAYRQLGNLYKARNRPADAVAMYREALARKPGWASVRIQLAHLLRYAGDWSGAAVEIRSAATDRRYAQSLAGELAETCYLGALDAHADGDDVLAVSLLDTARRQRSPYPAADHYLAYLRSLGGMRMLALQLMEAVERSQPGAPLVAENLQRARNGQLLVAPQTLEKALASRG